MNIAKVYDANVYVNNASKHGLASEITAPKIGRASCRERV